MEGKRLEHSITRHCMYLRKLFQFSRHLKLQWISIWRKKPGGFLWGLHRTNHMQDHVIRLCCSNSPPGKLGPSNKGARSYLHGPLSDKVGNGTTVRSVDDRFGSVVAAQRSLEYNLSIRARSHNGTYIRNWPM